MRSKAELEIAQFIRAIYAGEVQQNVRNVLDDRYELDIFLPALNLGFEYNGMVWHSEQFDKAGASTRHINKLNQANVKGIKLVQILEYEYLNHRDLVLSKISHIIGCQTNLPKIQARKCTIRSISNDVAKRFLNLNHIQGFAKSTVYLGAYYNSQLIGVMTLKRESSDSNSDAYNKWELTRFATDNNYISCGIGGKLFKHFIREHNPQYVKSFADRRWTVSEGNNLYTRLGFTLDSVTNPDYHYTNNTLVYIHKFNCRKNILIRKYPEANLTMDMTEHEMVQKIGLYRIWDCGLFKYVWRPAEA